MPILISSSSDSVAAYETDFSSEFNGEGVYLAGYYENSADEGGKWPTDTAKGSAIEMKKSGDVYTYTFTAPENGNPFRYGFKFCTSNGWMEQYINAKARALNVINQIDFGVEYDVIGKTKIELELKNSANHLLYADNATKFNLKYNLLKDKSYTITLNLATKKVKFEGETGDLIPNYTIADVNAVKGTVTGAWAVKDLDTDGSFEFTYDAATMSKDVRFIYGVKKDDGEDAGKNFKSQGSECKALNTDVLVEDDAGTDDYCKFSPDLFEDGVTYKVTLNRNNSTCKISKK